MKIFEYGFEDFCLHVKSESEIRNVAEVIETDVVDFEHDRANEPWFGLTKKKCDNLDESVTCDATIISGSSADNNVIIAKSSTSAGSGSEILDEKLTVGMTSSSGNDGSKGNTKSENASNELNLNFDFDKILQDLWNEAQAKGLFRYRFTRANVPTKILPGKYRFIAQLNPDRALKRRKPQEIHNLNQEFNPNDFHFGKAKVEEQILILKPKSSPSDRKLTGDEAIQNCGQGQDHVILINVSPLEYGHVLLVPFLSQHHPQRITLPGLKLAVELLLLSKSCDFRVGFNSLCGYASVNHHHYHAYYLKHRLFLEFAELKAMNGGGEDCPCKEIADYPAPGFAFTINAVEGMEIDNFVKDAFNLTSYLQENNIAHNVDIFRGSSVNVEGHFDSIRLFVWARSPSYGAKENAAFNPALCELGGHFPIKNSQAYDALTEELVCDKLREICADTFAKVRPFVAELFRPVVGSS